MEFRNAVLLPDGAIKCEFKHPDTGDWLPISAREEDRSYYAMAVFEAVKEELGVDIPIAPVIVASLGDLKARAFAGIDRAHADQLIQLTGNATDVERQTWTRKLLAARGVLSDVPPENDARALKNGAAQRGLTVEAFARVIISKDKAYSELVDDADAFRASAIAAISACETAEQVTDAITALAEQMASVIAARIAASNGS